MFRVHWSLLFMPEQLGSLRGVEERRRDKRSNVQRLGLLRRNCWRCMVPMDSEKESGFCQIFQKFHAHSCDEFSQ
jgi:hypothetical protein